MKVLVIEDEKMVAESIRAILESKGFEVETVYDGEAGTEYAELGIYDLLILDVMMPKLNGFQVARQVRADRCSTPILMLTARSDIEDRIQGLNAGADYYLTKPFDSRELLACVNALLRRQGDQVDELRMGNTALDLANCTLVCGDSSEFAFRYPLAKQEQAALLEKMDAYCLEQTGMALADFRARYLVEEPQPRQAPSLAQL